VKSPMLLFDPDPVAAAILATQLKHAGFPTYVAPDGAAAILSAAGKQFAAIVVMRIWRTRRCAIVCIRFEKLTPKRGLLSFRIRP